MPEGVQKRKKVSAGTKLVCWPATRKRAVLCKLAWSAFPLTDVLAHAKGRAIKRRESDIPRVQPSLYHPILTVDGGQREVGSKRGMGISSNIAIYVHENVTVRPIILLIRKYIHSVLTW